MRINLRGFWRVLIVVYSVGSVVGVVTGAVIAFDDWSCAHPTAAQLHFMRSLGNYDAPVCEPFTSPLLWTAEGVVVGFVLLFGGGLLVRWIYRGFTQPAA